eukprot:PhM_4_TR9837/c0_g2_i1/m.18093
MSTTQYYRSLYRLGFHPTATRAAMLLRISNSIPSRYQLCVFTTEAVLSFCVDTTQVLVVDITDKTSDYSSDTASTCLVVDDTLDASDDDNPDITSAGWSETSPPQHFVFASMCCHRALVWVWRWKSKFTLEEFRISLDMHHSCHNSNDMDTFNRVMAKSDHVLLELTLPSVITATRIGDKFAHGCNHLTYFDVSSLTNVTHIGDGFLVGCSRLKSLDLSPLSNVTHIGDSFLCRCTGLSSLHLSPFTNVGEIGDGFLYGCKGLTSLDMSPFTNVTHIGASFLYGCCELRSLDLSRLTNLSQIGGFFFSRCAGLTSLNVSPLIANVNLIGVHFLSRCAGLTTLDL